MAAYYNEFDPKAAQWLRELIKAGCIAEGDVDERSICDVQASDLVRYDQCHFFAGIGGWSLALRLAKWPDDKPVWTGSCPCQPFSSAGQQKGIDDERHLWPQFFRLIEEAGPQFVFGEQVASSEVVGSQLEAAFVDAVSRGDFAAANRAANKLVKQTSFDDSARWLDGVFTDLEGAGYACWSSVLGAHSVGAPHLRQRLYWMADSTGARQSGTRQGASDHGYGQNPLPQRGFALDESADGSQSGCMVDSADASGAEQLRESRAASGRLSGPQNAAEHSGPDFVGMGDSSCHDERWLSVSREHRKGLAVGGSGGTGCVADANGGQSADGDVQRGGQYGLQPEVCGTGDAMEYSASERLQQRRAESGGRCAQSRCGDGRCERVGDTDDAGPQGRGGSAECSGEFSAWASSLVIACSDGKSRRIPPEPEFFPLADGIPGRVGLLRGYGNAIVPQDAAVFIRTVMSESCTR